MGVQRNAGSGISPSGVGSLIAPPSAVTSLGIPARTGMGTGRVVGTRNNARWGSYVYAYPVYFGGGYYGGGYYDSAYAPQAPPASSGQEQPNVVVVYPPQQPPVIINQFGSGDGQYATRVQPQNIYPTQQNRAQAEEQPAPEPTHYLIAFKDHTIYSAVAYWVDGDTLHYFTTGSSHNQASVSLIDREMTDRLNRESGVEVKLPPVK
jgi:hypothetical protein